MNLCALVMKMSKKEKSLECSVTIDVKQKL